MKSLIAILIIIIWPVSLFSQSNEETYLLVTTSCTTDSTKEHISKSIKKNKELSEYPAIIIHVLSPDKNIRESFIHANYSDCSTPDKNKMEIKLISLPAFNKIKTIDLNRVLMNSDRDKFRSFCLKLRNSAIYVIDRNDIKKDTIKAFEVEHIRHLLY